MKIVCSASVARAREAFSSLGDVVVAADRVINAALLKDADALIVRSKVRVDERLLEGTQISFVGTATAGTDHMDLDYLNARGIVWCSAPGCNANSVAEYVVAALACLSCRHGFSLRGLTMAIVGVGHVGARVLDKARLLDMRVLLNDPPLFEATGDHGFRALDEILPEADIVTLHVPLEDMGAHPTRGLVQASFLSRLKSGAIFLNTCRGEVVEEDALRDALSAHRVRHAVLDVFDGEPAVDPRTVYLADLATPHIAGYSMEGRDYGTLMVYREACHFFEVPGRWVPTTSGPRIQGQIEAAGRRFEEVLWDAVKLVYPIDADDADLRRGMTLPALERMRHFDNLRANYRVRREFAQADLRVRGAGADTVDALRQFGFTVLD